QRIRWFRRVDHKTVQWLAACRVLGRQKMAPAFLAQIDFTQGSGNEQRPAFGADQKWDGNGCAMRGEQRRELAIFHAVKMAPPVKLLLSFPQTQHRTSNVKAQLVCPVSSIQAQFLHQRSISSPDQDGEWLRTDGHSKFAGSELLFLGEFARAELFLAGKRDEHTGRRARLWLPLRIKRF